MLVSGEIENVPLLDVLQVVAYSKQTGVLRVQGNGTQGAILFEKGAIVCGESTTSRALLERAASEGEPRRRLALRRVATLAVMTELLGLRSGTFRFQGTKERLAELEGVPLASFYDGETLETGELLLLYATGIDKPAAPPAEVKEPSSARERSHPRYAPTLIPARLASGGSALEGHLTNLSEGGAFFHGDTLPPADSVCDIRFVLPGDFGQIDCRARVVWARPDAVGGPTGAGLAFVGITHEGRGRLAAYLARYQRLADEYREPTSVKS
jgi:hypothetical protein